MDTVMVWAVVGVGGCSRGSMGGCGGGRNGVARSEPKRRGYNMSEVEEL